MARKRKQQPAEIAEDAEQQVRPTLPAGEDNARALRSDDWVEVRCIVSNVWTSICKMKTGQTDFLPPAEAEHLADLGRVELVPFTR